VIGFVKKNLVTIVNIVVTILFPIAGIVMALVRLIIKHWDKIKSALVKIFTFVAEKLKTIWGKIVGIVKAVIEKVKQAWGGITSFFASLWEGIVSVAINVWNAFKSWIAAFVEAVKAVWDGITGFFSGLWDGAVNTAMTVWDTLKSWFSGLVEGIKAIWNGIIGFFSGLWEAVQQGPAAAVEYIKNAFFGLFNSLQEKLFGFINKIKEGWETVKGFFGGIADGVVTFLTGGDGGGQMQPAYAGSTSQAAMAGAVGQTSNYAYTSTGGSSTVNAQNTFNVSVPAGTPQEQSEAIARQVSAQFEANLAGSINSSRANIPSPERRRR
jgi:phage-related protein